MEKNNFIELYKLNKNSNHSRESYIKSHYFNIYEDILNTNLKHQNIIFKQKLFNYINNIIDIPKCPVCNNIVNWNNSKNIYNKFCSNSCINKDVNIKIKIKQTVIDKYNCSHIFQNPKIKSKIKKTIFKKYGVENISQLIETKNKIKQTNLKILGVEYPTQSFNIKNKIKQTLIKNYGVDHPMKSDNIKNKAINSQTKNTIEISKKIFNNIEIINNGDYNYLIKNQCKIHNEYIINKKVYYWRVINKLINNPCIICNPINENSSLKENDIREFIEEFNIKTSKDNKILNGKEIDIYSSTHKLGIEFNGLYWHSSVYKDRKYHVNKTNSCEEQGIQLLHVFEDEWQNKKEIVKSIIKSKLGIYDKKIFARKTIIKEIDSKTSTKFLNDNHLQGTVGSAVKIGLYYNNELVSLMIFGKKRLSMGNKVRIEGKYEMLRFCNKLNITIIGGASKLLSYFIKTYQPKKIISFADRRYSNGNLYENLGFILSSITKPSYFYFKNNELIRYNRFNFRKDLLIKHGFNQNQTEFQIMKERGYLRIYDCGCKKYILKL